MPEAKTKPTAVNVAAFLAAVDPSRREDCDRLVALMSRVTGAPPVMWGPSMVGFGDHHYRYASGHEGDTFLAGFSPRKAAFSIYLVGEYGTPDRQALLDRLGRHEMGKGCLYVKRLADIDMDVLEALIRQSVEGLARG